MEGSAKSQTKVSYVLNDYDVTLQLVENKLLIEALHRVTEKIYRATVTNEELGNNSQQPGIFANTSILFYNFLDYVQSNGSVDENGTKFEIDDAATFVYRSSMNIGRVKMPIEVKIALAEEENSQPVNRLERALVRQANYIKELEEKVKVLDSLGPSYGFTQKSISWDANSPGRGVVQVSNNNKTAKVNGGSSNAWFSLYASEPVSQDGTGKYSYTIKIDNLSANRFIMMGVATKTHNSNYNNANIHTRAGSIFKYYQQNFYIDSTNYVSGDIWFLNKGDQVTILVDLDNGCVSFTVNNSNRFTTTYFNWQHFPDKKDIYPVIQLFNNADEITSE